MTKELQSTYSSEAYIQQTSSNNEPMEELKMLNVLEFNDTYNQG